MTRGQDNYNDGKSRKFQLMWWHETHHPVAKEDRGREELEERDVAARAGGNDVGQQSDIKLERVS